MNMMDEPLIRPQSTPAKSSRSFSDPPGALAPSPSIREKERAAQDDDALLTTPRPIRRPDFFAQGLTLHLPPHAHMANAMSTPSLPLAVPLSPKLDQHNIYMQSPSLSHSPATSLPRHSRGLDFSRACTTLHHSTLAEQSSPDSSPVITQKGVNIPGRKLSMSSMALDSPYITGPSSMPWGSLAHERSTVSSSVGSVNMLASESDSTDSGDEASMGDDNDDPLFTTPQVHKLQNPHTATPFNIPLTPGATGAWGSGLNFSPAQNSLMKTMRRTKLHTKNTRKSRHGSSSASNSGYSSLASPRTTSPPPLRSIETANNGYFALSNALRSRRESLALGTDGLTLSSGNESGDEASMTAPSTPGVIRRPVTRRGNMLPKTKGFARIRAALLEEATPADTDVRREAETIRQVRERDNSVTDTDLLDRQSNTAASSPNLLPAVPEAAQIDFGKELENELPKSRGLGMNFANHAHRNSAGNNFWNRFDPSIRTPPPPPSFTRQGSSIASDAYPESLSTGDTAMMQWRRPRARSSASDASEINPQTTSNTTAVPSSMHDDVHLKKFKRRREDDIDIATIKRRAVSPGMSTQNSPVMTNSPSQRDLPSSSGGGANGWGQPPERKDKKDVSNADIGTPGMPPTTRSGSGGSNMSLSSVSGAATQSSMSQQGNLVNQGKKLGLQPMSDTNDGLMKMSIE